MNLHHDKANWHTSAQTRDFLSTQNVDLMSHPQYSLDLAPNNYFLFPNIKKQLRGQRFLTPDDAIDAFNMHVL